MYTQPQYPGFFLNIYFKTVFVKIPLSANQAGFCLEGCTYMCDTLGHNNVLHTYLAYFMIVVFINCKLW